jgi:hypothetical protein
VFTSKGEFNSLEPVEGLIKEVSPKWVLSEAKMINKKKMENLPKNKKIILFDGVCNLCNTSIQFVIKHDKKIFPYNLI